MPAKPAINDQQVNKTWKNGKVGHHRIRSYNNKDISEKLELSYSTDSRPWITKYTLNEHFGEISHPAMSVGRLDIICTQKLNYKKKTLLKPGPPNVLKSTKQEFPKRHIEQAIRTVILREA